MARETAREQFTTAIARLVHRSYAEGLTVQEGNDIRDAASQAKRIYEAERERAERLCWAYRGQLGHPVPSGMELPAVEPNVLVPAVVRRAEQAEREREEWAQKHAALLYQYRACHDDKATIAAERDTLRQHNAVLRAECQAGRAMNDRAV